MNLPSESPSNAHTDAHTPNTRIHRKLIDTGFVCIEPVVYSNEVSKPKTGTRTRAVDLGSLYTPCWSEIRQPGSGGGGVKLRHIYFSTYTRVYNVRVIYEKLCACVCRVS